MRQRKQKILVKKKKNSRGGEREAKSVGDRRGGWEMES